MYIPFKKGNRVIVKSPRYGNVRGKVEQCLQSYSRTYDECYWIYVVTLENGKRLSHVNSMDMTELLPYQGGRK